MAVVFKPKRSSAAGAVPTTAQLTDGEVAVNTTDRKVYARAGSSVVKVANYSVLGDNSAILARRNSTAIQKFSAGAFATVLFNDVSLDLSGEYTASTGTTVIKAAGVYLVAATVHAGPVADGANFAVSIFVNGTERSRLAEQAPSNPGAIGLSLACGGATALQLSANDSVQIRVYVSATTDPTLLGVTNNFFAGTHLEIIRLF